MEISFILEFNCREPGNMATVWVAHCWYDDNDDKSPIYNELDGIRKLIGPIEYPIAQKLFTEICAAFRSYGYAVSSVETADD